MSTKPQSFESGLENRPDTGVYHIRHLPGQGRVVVEDDCTSQAVILQFFVLKRHLVDVIKRRESTYTSQSDDCCFLMGTLHLADHTQE